MTGKIKKTQSGSAGFSDRTECVDFGFRLITKTIYEKKIINIFLNPQISNVPKTLTGFCMVQLACLSHTLIAGYEEEITMNIKRNNKIVLAMICLTLFSTNVFAYSRQALTTSDAVTIKTEMAKPEHSAYSRISRSPNMVNSLRLMFLSSQKNKLPR